MMKNLWSIAQMLKTENALKKLKVDCISMMCGLMILHVMEPNSNPHILMVCASIKAGEKKADVTKRHSLCYIPR